MAGTHGHNRELVEGDEFVVRKDDRLVDAALRVLGRQLGRMLWNEPGTVLGEDPDRLHDMRVATRRMRAALRLFRRALPQRTVTALRRELEWLGGSLGRVRDLDVQLAGLLEDAPRLPADMAPALDGYIDHVRSHRAKARRAMLRTLGAKRYAALVARLRRLLAVGPGTGPCGPRANRPAGKAARPLILKRLEQVLDGGRALTPASSDAALHRVRILCKRLRYACEFFSDVHGKPAARFARRVRRLQDLLGAHQDAVVAQSTLSAYRERPPDLPPQALADLQRRHGRKARKGFFREWERFDRKKVREPLKRRLDRVAEGR